jgi:hypothetical protein
MIECAKRQDIKAAARIVVEALDRGFIDDVVDLFDELDDDDGRMIISLEVVASVRRAGRAEEGQ